MIDKYFPQFIIFMVENVNLHVASCSVIVTSDVGLFVIRGPENADLGKEQV